MIDWVGATLVALCLLLGVVSPSLGFLAFAMLMLAGKVLAAFTSKIRVKRKIIPRIPKPDCKVGLGNSHKV